MTATQRYRRKDSSLRLTFRFEGGAITLVDRQEVDVAAPPSENLERHQPERRSGFWVELQARDGRTLYRGVIRHPIRASAEVVAEEGGFTNQVSVAERGAFSLLVPNLPEADDLTLYSSPIDRPHLPEPATELMRVPVREPREEPKDRGPGEWPDQIGELDRGSEDDTNTPGQAGPDAD